MSSFKTLVGLKYFYKLLWKHSFRLRAELWSKLCLKPKVTCEGKFEEGNENMSFF